MLCRRLSDLINSNSSPSRKFKSHNDLKRWVSFRFQLPATAQTQAVLCNVVKNDRVQVN